MIESQSSYPVLFWTYPIHIHYDIPYYDWLWYHDYNDWDNNKIAQWLLVYVYIYIYQYNMFWLMVSTPLKNMIVRWDDYSQDMETNKNDVPNHQPDLQNLWFQWYDGYFPIFTRYMYHISHHSYNMYGGIHPIIY